MRAAALALALAGVQAAPPLDIIVRDGEIIPDNVRPCVDFIGRGALRSVGKSQLIDDPNDLIGHSLYSYRFDRDQTLFGKPTGNGLLTRAGHAPRKVDVDDAIVLITRNEDGLARFTGWEWVWHDRRDRPFIPIFWLGDRGAGGWKPEATRQFMKRVSYDDGQPYWADADFKDHNDEDDAALWVKSGAYYHVRYGIYLSDLPALMDKAAATERCWR